MGHQSSARGTRSLGIGSLLALGVNGIVGVGIFFLPATVAGYAPGAKSIWLFGTVALALVPVALAFGKLAQRFDEDGGPILYARQAFGERVSYLIGWIAYISSVISTATVNTGLTHAIAPNLGIHNTILERLFAGVLVSVIALVCAGGIHLSARVWNVLTLLKLLPLIALCIAALLIHPSIAPQAPTPTTPIPLSSWLRASLATAFAYQGFEVVPVIAGQARHPSRTIPFATIGSLLIAALLYIGLQSACVHAVPSLALSHAPLTDAARVYGGSSFAMFIQIATIVSALGISVGYIALTPHYLSSLAQNSALGFGLERVRKNGVPLRALIVTWALVVILVNAGSLTELLELASVAVVIQYAVVAISLAMLAWRRFRGLRPRDAAPALPTLGICAMFLSAATRSEWAAASIAVGLGILIRKLSR